MFFKKGNLRLNSTVAKNAPVQTEGQGTVEREIEYYNLDVIALTLLVAESDPKQKETMIKLIMNMLN